MFAMTEKAAADDAAISSGDTLTALSMVLEAARAADSGSITEPQRGACTFELTRGTDVWNIPNYVRITHDNTTIDPISQTVTIQYGKHTLIFDRYGKWPELNTFTRDLWKYIIYKTTEVINFNGNERQFEFSSADVADAFKRADDRHLRDDIIEALEILRTLGLPFKSTARAKKHYIVNISMGAGVLSNGTYGFEFTPTSWSLLQKAALMRINPSIFMLDRQRSPNGSAIMMKLYEDMNMNIGKSREGIISVRSILDSCPNIPSEEEVRAGGRHYTARISKPLDKELDLLVEAGELDEFCYMRAHGRRLDDDEVKSGAYLEYKVYKTLYIHYVIAGYPYERARAEAAANRRRRRGAAERKARRINEGKP